MSDYKEKLQNCYDVASMHSDVLRSLADEYRKISSDVDVVSTSHVVSLINRICLELSKTELSAIDPAKLVDMLSKLATAKKAISGQVDSQVLVQVNSIELDAREKLNQLRQLKTYHAIDEVSTDTSIDTSTDTNTIDV